MPRYSTVGKEHAHALGVITLNYNQFEFIFFRLFAHHLERLKVPIEVAWHLYSQLQVDKRPKTTKYLFSKCESDPIVVEHVTHAFTYFHRCNTNRDYLFHSDVDNSPEVELRLRKGIKEDWSRVNHFDLDLKRLRQIADDMFTGWEYVWDVWAYMQRRDKVSQMPPFLVGMLPGALPQKPALPKSLNPSQSQRTP